MVQLHPRTCSAVAVAVLGADPEDWLLLLRMTSVSVPAGEAFQDLVEVADQHAVLAAERVERVLPAAPIRVDAGLCRHAVDLLRTSPGAVPHRGLAHGDLNPGNILRHDGGAAGEEDGSAVVAGDRPEAPTATSPVPG